MIKGNGTTLILGLICLVAGFLSHKTTIDYYQSHTAYVGGLTAQSKVVQVDELDTFGRASQRVTVEFKDTEGMVRRSTMEGTGFSWFKKGNIPHISYRPGNFDSVRWPTGRMPEKRHQYWLLAFKGFKALGFVLLVIPVVRFYRD